MRLVIRAICVICGCLLLCGCASKTDLPKTNSLPPLNDDLARVDENLAGARRNVEGAVPHTDEVGKGLLGSAVQQIVAGANRVGNMFVLSAKAQQERDQAITAAGAWEGKYTTIYNSLPMRVWRWIVRLFWIWILVHVGLGVAGLFVPGPIGAGMAVVSHLANPLSWFTAARENVWFRWLKPTAA